MFYHMMYKDLSNEVIMPSAVTQLEPNPGLAPISERDRIGSVIKAIVRAADAWELTNAEAAGLFDVPGGTWSRLKGGTY